MGRLAARGSIELPASVQFVSVAALFVREFCARCQEEAIREDILFNLELIASELCTNIAVHAYRDREPGAMRVDIRVGEGRVELAFTDRGRRFDPASVPEPDFQGMAVGGRGLYIVRQSASRMEYSSRDGANTLRVEVDL